MVQLFNDLLQPEISKNYLSHLKSAIEDTINERLKKVIIASLSDGPDTGEDHKKFIDLIKNKNIKPFSIQFVPMPKLTPKATTRSKPTGAIIYYLDALDINQIRVLLAHELGHIALKHFASVDRSTKEPEANLFAIIAMYDKSIFYKNASSKYSFSERDLLDQFRLLSLGGVK